MYKYLIVGSGLYGSTIAQRLKKNGETVCVIERRPYVAGNVYTEKTKRTL